VPTLLRGDFTEFYGGAHVTDLNWPDLENSRWDVRTPQGRAIRHRLTEPVGLFPSGFTIQAYTEEAQREIQAEFLAEEFVLEAHGRRYTIKFTEPAGIEFAVDVNTRRLVNNRWFGLGTASSGSNVEIVSVDPLPGFPE
jgi:hypothetical protein